MALVLNRKNSVVVKKICQEKDGFFVWDDVLLNSLRKDQNMNRNEIQMAKFDLVSYLFELVYDLCLGKQDNVSSSPGFEKFIGQFGRRKE